MPPVMLPISAWANSFSSGSPVTKLMPPPSVRQTSSCRHITPFGMPVVPPV